MEQRCKGTMAIWAEPFTPLRVAKLFNLRTDPYEFADMTSNSYYDWFLHHDYIIYGAIALIEQVQRDVHRLPEDPEAQYLYRGPGGRENARDGRRQLTL